MGRKAGRFNMFQLVVNWVLKKYVKTVRLTCQVAQVADDLQGTLAQFVVLLVV